MSEKKERDTQVTQFFGFAVADGMFSGSETTIRRNSLTVEEVREAVVAGVSSCCNPSHKPTIDAMRVRFGLEVSIPEKAPMVSLRVGDSLIVMSVRGLARLEGRHEYNEEEISKASFSFSKYTVIA